MKPKKILLFVPDFYNYHTLIKDSLVKKGHDVEMVLNKIHKEDIKSSTNIFLSILLYLKNPNYKVNYTNSMLEIIKDKNFDLLFVINGFSITSDLINEIKIKNRNLISVIFFWDSFAYWKYQNLIPLFDVKYTFDYKDFQKFKNNGLQYLQDFFVNKFTERVEKKDYDLCCIASINKFSLNRLNVLKAIHKQCEQNNLKTYFKIYYPSIKANLTIKTVLKLLLDKTTLYIYLWRLFNPRLDFIMNEKIPFTEMVKIEKSSSCIVDIPPKKQNGLTIRSLEAIASSQKLITTNKIIMCESFYHPNNVFIINSKKPLLSLEFLKKEQVEINISYLKLDNWVEKILKSTETKL